MEAGWHLQFPCNNHQRLDPVGQTLGKSPQVAVVFATDLLLARKKHPGLIVLMVHFTGGSVPS